MQTRILILIKIIIAFILLFNWQNSGSPTPSRVFNAGFDLGWHFVRIQNPDLNINPVWIPHDSVRRRLFGDVFFSLGIEAKVLHVLPFYSIGLFAKPGLSTNIGKRIRHDEWFLLQLPFGLLSEIGSGKPEAPGLTLGVGYTFNVYDFSEWNVPVFHGLIPYCFAAAHYMGYGARFALMPIEEYRNANGTTTKTLADFTLSIYATAPLMRRNTPHKK